MAPSDGDDELGRRRDAELRAAGDALAHLEAETRRLRRLVGSQKAEIEAIRTSRTFRFGSFVTRLARGRPTGTAFPPVPAGDEPAETGDPSDPTSGPGTDYSRWVDRFDTVDDDARAALRDRLLRVPDSPLVSIILPVRDTPEARLRRAIDSVRSQIYGHWQLCVCDDGSSHPHVAKIIADYAAGDPRITVITRLDPGGFSTASNSALETATGTWITALGPDDVLTEHALALAVVAGTATGDAAVVYSDEDALDDSGQRRDPYFKGDFDPLLLVGQNYLRHLVLIRRDLVGEAGGYPPGPEDSASWDLILRVTENLQPAAVVHVPHVLYHARRRHRAPGAPPLTATDAAAGAERAVAEHLARQGRRGDVAVNPARGYTRVRWHLPTPAPLVSIIVPTRDGPLLQRCLDSVLQATLYPHYEIVVVDNGSQSRATLEYLRANEDRLQVLRDDRPFNYSALNNNAVRRASGTVLCLLNDDTEVIGGQWLDEMVGQLLQPAVGAVGAKLHYPDGRIQHGGVIVGLGSVAGHAHRLSERWAPGHGDRLLVAQTLSAVTGACMAVRRQAWDEVGGLDEVNLAVAFNDIDFCLRLGEAGWRVVWTPQATLEHHESVSRGTDTAPDRAGGFSREVAFMQSRWGERLRVDPAYNPNLTVDTEDYALAWPPRVSYR